jgi:hypothetical protein
MWLRQTSHGRYEYMMIDIDTTIDDDTGCRITPVGLVVAVAPVVVLLSYGSVVSLRSLYRRTAVLLSPSLSYRVWLRRIPSFFVSSYRRIAISVTVVSLVVVPRGFPGCSTMQNKQKLTMVDFRTSTNFTEA